MLLYQRLKNPHRTLFLQWTAIQATSARNRLDIAQTWYGLDGMVVLKRQWWFPYPFWKAPPNSCANIILHTMPCALAFRRLDCCFGFFQNASKHSSLDLVWFPHASFRSWRGVCVCVFKRIGTNIHSGLQLLGGALSLSLWSLSSSTLHGFFFPACARWICSIVLFVAVSVCVFGIVQVDWQIRDIFVGSEDNIDNDNTVKLERNVLPPVCQSNLEAWLRWPKD